MTVYNKLKIAILAIFSSQPLYAITLDPLQIQSAPGELLYAEMSFHQANSNDKLDVSLATPEDLMMIGAAHQPPSGLNFYTRRNTKGEGVIVITSTRPMIDSELNIILKIQEGNASHLKHIKQPIRQGVKNNIVKTNNEKSLTPKFIVSEKDIALNLPESTHFNTATSTPKQQNNKQENLLNAPFTLPPVLNNAQASTSAPTTISTVPSANLQQPAAVEVKLAQENIIKAANQEAATPTTTQQDNNPIAETAKSPEPLPSVEGELKATDKKEVEPNKVAPLQVKQAAIETKKQKTPTPPVDAAEGQKQHIVQRNESLWRIAQRISAKTQQPVAQVMNQIKAQNEHAFIDGNANRLRQGSRLNFNLNSIPVRSNQTVNQIATQTPRSPSTKAKYRLQQAEMSLVAESNQDSSTGSAKKDTLQKKTSADLSLKVMTAREKTVTLQRNVTQLELALRTKEQRIQLLNARLAELQEQLKAQQETKKPTH
ncbi:FimV domain-containing protein [Acinetobacter beijerinckii]|uniref:type IV pilus assembly protein FimV n=1 Tax=Acinetobacter beijerinckii TaxID=262668 RepID=UPI0024060C4E|nr:FimV domain-containing protein [Acinetobacter beijerinckii]